MQPNRTCSRIIKDIVTGSNLGPLGFREQKGTVRNMFEGPGTGKALKRTF